MELGQPTNLFPANGAVDQLETINLSWQSVQNAASYDLYVWKANETQPTNPSRTGITQIGYTFTDSSIEFGETYKWQVVARNNSCSTASVIQEFTIRELPDLTVNNIQVPSNPFSEQNIEVSWRVTNSGSGGTKNNQWFDAVYLSNSGILDGSETYLGAFSNVSALGVGQSYMQTAELILPRGIQGTYYIIIQTDQYRRITESDETNNEGNNSMLVTLTPPPDLQVSSIIKPNNAFSGQDITINWKVTNEGTGATTVSRWYDRIYISNSEVFNPFLSTQLKNVYHDNGTFLNETESYTKSTTVRIPEEIFGDYYIHVVTDQFDDVYEFAFEDNNTGTSISINIILTPPPDLVVNEVNVPDSLDSGASFLVQWEVTNEGANPAEASWQDIIYISSDSIFNSSNATSLPPHFVGTDLGIGDSYTTQKTVNLPNNLEGKYYIYVETDYTDRVFEFNKEDNNLTRSDSVIVSIPDLVVANINIPDIAKSGQELTIQWTVRNQGIGGVLSASVRDDIFLSTQPILDNTAINLGSLSYTLNLDRGASTVKQQTVDIQDGIEGSYYVIIKTDNGNRVYENNNEDNNERNQSLQINLAPYPDLIVSNIQGLPDSAVAGIPFPMSFEVSNVGDTTAQGTTWLDRIYVSVEPTWNVNEATFVTAIERLQSLDNGKNYVVNYDLKLPMLSLMVPGLDSFSYVYVYVQTDATDAIYEYDIANDNNITKSDSIWVTCPPPVDLQPIQANSSGDNFFSGDPIRVQWTVKNLGSTTEFWDYPFWYDGFFLSRDTVWDKGDTFIIDFTEPGPLAEGTTYTDLQSFNLPNIASGRYYLLLVADHQNRNRDGDLSNNAFVIPFNGQIDTTGNGGGIDPIEITQTLYPDLKANSLFAPSQGTTGQPITVNWNVSNVGDASTNRSWIDQVYLSTDFVVDGSDIILGSRTRSSSLAVGNDYDESIEIELPIDAVGNYILLFKTDASNQLYELNREGNNIISTNLFIQRPEPADLVVTDITAPTIAMVNEDMDVSWVVENKGNFPASGRQKDIVYLSIDNLLSPNDIRLGITEINSNIAPLGQETRSLTMTPTPGLSVGDYFLLVQTDALNNIYESIDTNNVAVAPNKITITVPELPLDTEVLDDLDNETDLYYRIEIPDSLAGETMLVTLTGDEQNGRNELYLSHNSTPTRASHDFSFGNVLEGTQDVVVPELKAGTYYLLAYGVDRIDNEQDITLKAEIIPFQIRTVSANKGGNTGSMTVKVEGAKFEENMMVAIEDATLGMVTASNVYFISPTSVFATFNLSGAAEGIYDVKATKAGESATLGDGFEVVAGAVGSFGGGSGTTEDSGFFCSIENIGVSELLSSNVQHPANTRLNRVVPITIQFGNSGNIDVAAPCRFIISLAGAPLALTPNELDQNKQELFLEFKEPNGPPNILRPGATSSITIYTKAVAPLRFNLTN